MLAKRLKNFSSSRIVKKAIALSSIVALMIGNAQGAVSGLSTVAYGASAPAANWDNISDYSYIAIGNLDNGAKARGSVYVNGNITANAGGIDDHTGNAWYGPVTKSYLNGAITAGAGTDGSLYAGEWKRQDGSYWYKAVGKDSYNNAATLSAYWNEIGKKYGKDIVYKAAKEQGTEYNYLTHDEVYYYAGTGTLNWNTCQGVLIAPNANVNVAGKGWHGTVVANNITVAAGAAAHSWKFSDAAAAPAPVVDAPKAATKAAPTFDGVVPAANWNNIPDYGYITIGDLEQNSHCRLSVYVNGNLTANAKGIDDHSGSSYGTTQSYINGKITAKNIGTIDFWVNGVRNTCDNYEGQWYQRGRDDCSCNSFLHHYKADSNNADLVKYWQYIGAKYGKAITDANAIPKVTSTSEDGNLISPDDVYYYAGTGTITITQQTGVIIAPLANVKVLGGGYHATIVANNIYVSGDSEDHAWTWSKDPGKESSSSKKPTTSSSEKPATSSSTKTTSSSEKPATSSSEKPATSSSEKPATSSSKKPATSSSEKPATSSSTKTTSSSEKSSSSTVAPKSSSSTVKSSSSTVKSSSSTVKSSSSTVKSSSSTVKSSSSSVAPKSSSSTVKSSSSSSEKSSSSSSEKSSSSSSDIKPSSSSSEKSSSSSSEKSSSSSSEKSSSSSSDIKPSSSSSEKSSSSSSEKSSSSSSEKSSSSSSEAKSSSSSSEVKDTSSSSEVKDTSSSSEVKDTSSSSEVKDTSSSSEVKDTSSSSEVKSTSSSSEVKDTSSSSEVKDTSSSSEIKSTTSSSKTKNTSSKKKKKKSSSSEKETKTTVTTTIMPPKDTKSASSSSAKKSSTSSSKKTVLTKTADVLGEIAAPVIDAASGVLGDIAAPLTGDDMNPTAWLALAIAAAGVLAALIAYTRKQKN